MQSHEQPLKDPASGYASADALEERTPKSQDHVDRADRRDPMNGYASAELLGKGKQPPRRPKSAAHADEMQDPMNGYTSADVLGPEPA